MRLKLRRLSAMPRLFDNGSQSYCYAIEETTKEQLAGYAGVYETKSGLCIYSPARVGEHNKPFTAELTDRVVGDKTYLNLSDKNADVAGELGSLYNMATKLGFADKTTFTQSFLNATFSKGKGTNQAIQAEQPVVVNKEVVAEPAAGATVAG